MPPPSSVTNDFETNMARLQLSPSNYAQLVILYIDIRSNQLLNVHCFRSSSSNSVDIQPIDLISFNDSTTNNSAQKKPKSLRNCCYLIDIIYIFSAPSVLHRYLKKAATPPNAGDN